MGSSTCSIHLRPRDLPGSAQATTFPPWAAKTSSMSDVYTSLGVSPRKKRRASPGADEALVLTPKRIRTRFVHVFHIQGVNLG